MCLCLTILSVKMLIFRNKCQSVIMYKKIYCRVYNIQNSISYIERKFTYISIYAILNIFDT